MFHKKKKKKKKKRKKEKNLRHIAEKNKKDLRACSNSYFL